MSSRIFRTFLKIKFIIFITCMCFMKPKKNNNIAVHQTPIARFVETIKIEVVGITKLEIKDKNESLVSWGG